MANEGGERKSAKTEILEQLRILEATALELRKVFRDGQGTVNEEFLTLESLEQVRCFVVAYQATASILWGRAKSIVARGDARIRVARSTAYADIRQIGRELTAAAAEDLQGEPEIAASVRPAPPRVPAQKDAEIIANAKIGRQLEEMAELEGLLARATAVNECFKAYSEALTGIGWLRNREWSNTP
jgi:hypothetical protein